MLQCAEKTFRHSDVIDFSGKCDFCWDRHPRFWPLISFTYLVGLSNRLIDLDTCFVRILCRLKHRDRRRALAFAVGVLDVDLQFAQVFVAADGLQM